MNRDNAAWCTQCYLDLRPAPAPEPVAAPAPERTDAAAAELAALSRGWRQPETAPVADAPDTTAVETIEAETDVGRFRQTGDELEWNCGQCGEWNPVGATACSVCGTPFGRGVPEPVVPPRVSDTTALIASAAVPGLGHMLLGRTGNGVARALTYLLWLIGGIVLIREATLYNRPILPGIPLVLGALVVWVTSAIDAMNLARGGTTELLRPRVFFWLMLGVIGLLMITFIATAARLPRT